jgi:hypothetical protein
MKWSAIRERYICWCVKRLPDAGDPNVGRKNGNETLVKFEGGR